MGSPYTHGEVPGQNGYGTAAGVVGMRVAGFAWKRQEVRKYLLKNFYP
jgi:hypothetical protein